MGQKAKPKLLRLKINEDWESNWYASKKDFPKYLEEDKLIRSFFNKHSRKYLISKLNIVRTNQRIIVKIMCARTGLLMGKSGDNINQLNQELNSIVKSNVVINVIENKKPEQSAKVISESIAMQLEKRVSFRNAMKRAAGNAIKSGAKGIKIKVSGRLGGVEIARSESILEGSVPLHTFRAKIEQSFAEADTIYGKIGVQVLVNHGESHFASK